jgi:hypothetical protein
MRLLVPTLALAAALAVALPVPAAHARDCDALPTSAQRPRPCNPQQECLVKVQKTLAGSTLVSAQEGCRRMPTSGTCYGPETYNPQAECRQREQPRQRR